MLQSSSYKYCTKYSCHRARVINIVQNIHVTELEL